MPLEFIAHDGGSGDEDINPLERLLSKYRWLERNRLAFLSTTFFLVFFVWACFAKLEKFSTLPGSVIPQEKTQIIQHLEGGIIEDILVNIGDQVEKGDILFKMDLAGSQREEQLQAELDGYVLRKSRIDAEISGEALSLPEEEAQRRPEIAAAERGAYFSARNQLDSRLQILDAQIEQDRRKISENEARRNTFTNDLEIQQETANVKEELYKQGLSARVEYLQAKARVEQIEGRLKELEEVILASRSALVQVEARREEVLREYQRSLSREKLSADNLLAQTRIEYLRAKEASDRKEVVAPLRGIVKQIYFNTIGGVVRPGDPVMEIVPSGENLVIEGRLPPHERGFVRVDQDAIVKITAYDFLLYGGLVGKVEQISADTLPAPDGSTYFRVVIKTDRNYVGSQPGLLPISPGMEVTADIHTDDRTVISYMMRPVFRLKHSAFRE